MTYYDYKVVPAPKRAKRVKGVHGAEDLFALTLTESINEVARQGWEYVRAEHLPAEAPRGWFRGARAAEQTVLVFRRARESAGPRLVAATRPEPAAAEPAAPEPPRPPAEQAAVDRLAQRMRREPPLRLEPLPAAPTSPRRSARTTARAAPNGPDRRPLRGSSSAGSRAHRWALVGCAMCAGAPSD